MENNALTLVLKNDWVASSSGNTYTGKYTVGRFHLTDAFIVVYMKLIHGIEIPDLWVSSSFTNIPDTDTRRVMYMEGCDMLSKETMNEIRAALDKIDPSIFMYGEGWTASGSPLAEEKRAVKKNAKLLEEIAVFSDDIRDALKGSWMHAEIPGFVSGIDSLEESVKFGVVGATEHRQVDYSKLIYSKEPYVNNPTQIINYVSCHDDMCLVDKLKEAKPTDATDDELIRFNKLAQTIVFTSQGVPFIYAGEELYRNKKGVHNTYQSPDSINQINWDNKTKYIDIFNYYQGLIALRKAHPAFRIPTAEGLR